MAKRTKTQTRASKAASDTAVDIMDNAAQDIGTLIAESERDNQTLINVLEQAQSAQKSLLAAQKRLKTLETRQEAEHRKSVTLLVGERDTARDQATRLAHEKATLGFYVSGHPLEAFRDLVSDFATHTTARLRDAEAGAELAVAGRVGEMRKRKSKKSGKW